MITNRQSIYYRTYHHKDLSKQWQEKSLGFLSKKVYQYSMYVSVGILLFMGIYFLTYQWIYPKRDIARSIWKGKALNNADIIRDFFLSENHIANDSSIYSSSNRTSSIESLSLAEIQDPLLMTLYTVRKGDNLDKITKSVGISLSTIVSINQLKSDTLYPGQTLKIPNIDGIFYTIRKGDSLYSIASQYKISIYDILDVNDLDTTVIQANKILFLPNITLSNEKIALLLGNYFIFPLKQARITSYFGKRKDPISYKDNFHTGIDMVSYSNSQIKASMSGKIIQAQYNSILGNHVIIQHNAQFKTIYAHLRTINVRKGMSVKTGDIIGKMGSSGYSTGPHLHFSILYKNIYYNPLKYLSQR